MSKITKMYAAPLLLLLSLQQTPHTFAWSTVATRNHAVHCSNHIASPNNKHIRIKTITKQYAAAVPDDDGHDTSEKQKQNQQQQQKQKSSGDALRRQTGIRPSLHPITINALTEALRLRASKEGEVMTMASGENALEVAMLAGKLAIDALAKREEMLRSVTNVSSSNGAALDDGEDNLWELPTEEEKQVIAGRVLGVVMRLKELEQSLVEKVSQTKWVVKYGEHETFGVLATEADIAVEVGYELDERLNIDPLFRMNRAECLLALFIESVEKPQLAKAKASVSDGSKVDFIDEDRLEVLTT